MAWHDVGRGATSYGVGKVCINDHVFNAGDLTSEKSVMGQWGN